VRARARARSRSPDLIRQQRVGDHVAALAADLQPAPLDALAGEARFLGHALGGGVLDVRVQLEPLGDGVLDHPPHEQDQCPRRDAAASLRAGDPVAELGAL